MDHNETSVQARDYFIHRRYNPSFILIKEKTFLHPQVLLHDLEIYKAGKKRLKKPIPSPGGKM